MGNCTSKSSKPTKPIIKPLEAEQLKTRKAWEEARRLLREQEAKEALENPSSSDESSVGSEQGKAKFQNRLQLDSTDEPVKSI